MRQIKFYLQPFSNKQPGNTSGALKSRKLLNAPMVAVSLLMLFSLLLSKPAISQTTAGRSSTAIAGASPFQDSLWLFNTTDYSVVKRLKPTISGGTITGINGLAKDPTNGLQYCILKVSGTPGRVLATINLATGVCTTVGNLGDNFSSIAFNANGTLFGITGDGASTPSTMYWINKSNASKLLFKSFAAGNDGEVIVYNNDDNHFYRFSGGSVQDWERFDTTATGTIETLTKSGSASETFGALYLGGNEILVSDIASHFKIWTLSGSTASVGASLTTAPDDIRGMTTNTVSSSVSTATNLVCSGATVNISVTGGAGSYQWYMNGSMISGATNATYGATTGGHYNVTYADMNGIVDSTAAGIVLTNVPVPGISLVAHPQVCYGATTTGISFNTATNFSFSGTSSTYYIPQGVTSIDFDISGAVGGNDSSAAPTPGKGGRVQGSLAVTPGDMITIMAGGAGSTGTITGAMGGFNGGGNSAGYGGSGGGATDIRLNGTALINRVAVAGGGAGSGFDGTMSVSGGSGGDLIGADGAANADASFATGGSQLAGGIGAMLTGSASGMDGILAMGGDGSTDGVSGAGGGGYFGGGGGAGSGGAGGSSYSDATLVSAVTHTQGYNAISGQATISFGVPSSYTYSIFWDAPAITAGFTNVTPTPFPTSSAFPVTIPATATPNSYTGVIVMSDGTCTYSEPISVTIKPIPDVAVIGNQTMCNGVNTTDVMFTGTLPSTSFDWTNDNTATGLAASGTGDILSFTSNNTTSTIQTSTVTVTPKLNGCSGPSETFAITVKPTPKLASASLAGFVCDNTSFDYTATGTVSGTTFAWTRDPLSGSVVAPGASGTNTISETFDNTGTGPVAVTYTYTLTANGCENIQYVTATINPTPALYPTPLVGTICSEGTFTYLQSSLTSGVSYSWSRAAVTGISTAASSGTGDISEMLTNSTPDPVTVTYVDTLNINGCKYTENVSVVVNPMPVLSSTLTPPSVCDNATFIYTATTATTGTTISWERFPIAGIATVYSSGSTTINETHDNTTDNAIGVVYNFTLSANGCTKTQNVVVMVNATPELNTTLTPAAICDSTFFDYVPGSNTTGAAFSWSRAVVPGVPNPASTGTGNPHERLRNTTNLPVAVTYVFTITVDGCTNTQNVVVSVNPLPKLTNTPLSFNICDNSAFTFIPTSSTVGFTTEWTRAFVGGIGNGPGAGTGNIVETLKNNTNANVTVDYVYVVSANGCSSMQTLKVLVHPTPELNSSLLDSACSGAPFIYTPASNTIPAVSYAWQRATVAGITPLTGAGTGSINETLLNTTTSTINVVYVYTMTVGASCTNTAAINVKVRPAAEVPVIGVMPGASLCSGAMYQNFGAATPAATGVTYAWSATNSEVYATGSGNQYAIVNFNTAGTAVVTLSATIGSTGCTGSASYTVNVGTNEVVTPSVIYSKGKLICLQNDVKTFQWGYDDATTLDSAILKGEINQSYFKAPLELATKHYWVMTTTSNGCMQKAYYNKPGDNTPKINFNTDEDFAGIRVFPNPASGQINVEVNTLVSGNVEVKLVNMLGQVLNIVSAADHKASINIANLPAGVYMVDCYQNDSKIGTARFVKN